MAALTATRTPHGQQVARIVILILALVLYFTPLVSAAIFGFTLPGKGFTFGAVVPALSETGFWSGVITTIELAILTSVLSLALLLPTLIWLHLRSPRLLAIAEGLSLIPFVVPAVALVSGANLFFRAVAPSFLVSVYSLVPFYVVLALPLVFRALDAGIRAIDVRTLMDAAASVGAGGFRSIVQIIQPNLRSAILSATLLSSAFVIGEYALASLLLHSTFPVLVVVAGQTEPRAAAALSFIAIVGTWLLMLLLSISSGGKQFKLVAITADVESVDKKPLDTKEVTLGER